ncbi:hypothetical protein BDA99DRAFT_533962 [Phascolomyces articulosus]|uniref:Uncharacterized protein n=1 Tax=Phascolomyces articulosus TaxID=60185 RepID=A0AAD5K6I1_9FUNG|nr:hypothetical protein BDA99DRAFT_533962 [Phascolomyces articulosus]
MQNRCVFYLYNELMIFDDELLLINASMMVAYYVVNYIEQSYFEVQISSGGLIRQIQKCIITKKVPQISLAETSISEVFQKICFYSMIFPPPFHTYTFYFLNLITSIKLNDYKD